MRFISGDVSSSPDNISDIHNLKSRYRTADTGIMDLDNLLRSFSAPALQQNEFFQSLQVFFADNGLLAFSGYDIVYPLLLCIQFCSGKFIFKTLEQFGKTECFCFSVNTEPRLSAFGITFTLPFSHGSNSANKNPFKFPVGEPQIVKARQFPQRHFYTLKEAFPPCRLQLRTHPCIVRKKLFRRITLIIHAFKFPSAEIPLNDFPEFLRIEEITIHSVQHGIILITENRTDSAMSGDLLQYAFRHIRRTQFRRVDITRVPDYNRIDAADVKPACGCLLTRRVRNVLRSVSRPLPTGRSLPAPLPARMKNC